MSTRPSPILRRALAAGAVALVLAGAGMTTALPAGAQTDMAPTTEPAPSTEVAPAEGGDGADTSTTVAEGDDGAADDAAVEDAQAQADADLRSVWVIVAALGAVAVGLLVLLVLYIRATNPERAARRRAHLIARAEERDRTRGRVDPDDEIDDDLDNDDEDEADDRTELVAAAAAAGPAPDRAEAGSTPGRKAAAPVVLSRDPEESGDEAVRVLGAPVAADVTPGVAVRPESTTPPITSPTGPGARRRSPSKQSAGASSRRPAPAGPPPGPADGDETVRIVPAPDGPHVVPASAGRGAVVTASPGGTAGDRPPPRTLVDSPPPPRRPRRVEGPAKGLGTPDAERVLVRPGQKPVRVPPAMSRPGPRAEAPADEPADEPDPPAPSDGDDDR